jgi:hypothetical protein
MGKPAEVERPVILAEYSLKEAPKSPKGDFLSRSHAPAWECLLRRSSGEDFYKLTSDKNIQI